jgi:hypothetical protein
MVYCIASENCTRLTYTTGAPLGPVYFNLSINGRGKFPMRDFAWSCTTAEPQNVFFYMPAITRQKGDYTIHFYDGNEKEFATIEINAFRRRPTSPWLPAAEWQKNAAGNRVLTLLADSSKPAAFPAIGNGTIGEPIPARLPRYPMENFEQPGKSFSVSRLGNKLNFTCRDGVESRIHDHLLVRYWVNGNPVIQRLSRTGYAIERMGPILYLKTFSLSLPGDFSGIGAGSGDKIEMQFLLARAGWSDRPEDSFCWLKGPQCPVSNRISITCPAP